MAMDWKKWMEAGRKPGVIREFVRFCVVGVVCTAIDAAVFYAVRRVAPYQAALVCGYLLSLVVNCFLTLRWTFACAPSVRRVAGIVGAHLVNLFVVRMGLMALAVGVCRLNDGVAYLPVVGISVVVNFVLVRLAAKA